MCRQELASAQEDPEPDCRAVTAPGRDPASSACSTADADFLADDCSPVASVAPFSRRAVQADQFDRAACLGARRHLLKNAPVAPLGVGETFGCRHGFSCNFGAKCKHSHFRVPAAGVSEPQVFHRAAWLAVKGGCAREPASVGPLFGRIKHVLLVLAELLRECAGTPDNAQQALSAVLCGEGEARLEHLRRVFTSLGVAVAEAEDAHREYRASADACNASLESISNMAVQLPYDLRHKIEVEGRSMKQEEWLSMFHRHGEQQGEASVRQLFANIEEALHAFRHEGPLHGQHKAVVEQLTSYLEDELALWVLRYYWGFDLAEFGGLAGELADQHFHEALGAEGNWFLANLGLHWRAALGAQQGVSDLQRLFEKQDQLRDRLRALGVTSAPEVAALPDQEEVEVPRAASWLSLGDPMYVRTSEASPCVTAQPLHVGSPCQPDIASHPLWSAVLMPDVLRLMALQHQQSAFSMNVFGAAGSLDHSAIQAAALEKCRQSMFAYALGAVLYR